MSNLTSTPPCGNAMEPTGSCKEQVRHVLDYSRGNMLENIRKTSPCYTTFHCKMWYFAKCCRSLLRNGIRVKVNFSSQYYLQHWLVPTYQPVCHSPQEHFKPYFTATTDVRSNIFCRCNSADMFGCLSKNTDLE